MMIFAFIMVSFSEISGSRVIEAGRNLSVIEIKRFALSSLIESWKSEIFLAIKSVIGVINVIFFSILSR